MLDPRSRPIEYTLIYCIRNTVVDEFCQDQPILAFVEHLEGVGGEGETMSDVRIPGKDSINMPGELCPLVLIDCVGYIGRRSLDLDPSAYRASSYARFLRVQWRGDAVP